MPSPVTSMENFLLQAGPAPAIGIWLLEGPGSTEKHLSEIRHAVSRSHTFQKSLKRWLTWHFWNSPTATDNPSDHVICLDAPEVRTLEDLADVTAKLARLGFDPERPRWRIVLLNTDNAPQGALSAFLLHFDHAIADGIRVERFVRDMADMPDAPGYANGSRETPEVIRLNKGAFERLEEQFPENRIHPGFVKVSKSEIRDCRPKSTSTTEFVVDAFANMLDDEELYSDTTERTHLAIVTSSLSAERSLREGNRFMAFERDALPRRLKDAGLSRSTGRTSTWRQTLASPLPRFLMRWLIRFWYRQFDVMLNVIPAATRPFQLGGAKASGGYGIPPLLTDMPLTADMICAVGAYHFTLLPGKSCQVGSKTLCSRLARELTVKTVATGSPITTSKNSQASRKAAASAL